MTDATPYVALNGKRVTQAHVTIPYYGAWVADVTLAVFDEIDTSETLTIGNLSLKGAVYRVASFAGALSARIVAGGAGWRQTVPAQGYYNPKGINASIVLRDAAALVGEQVNIASDYSLGTQYARENAPASRVLAQLAGPEWWIDNSGVTQIGSRPSTAITTPFQLLHWYGGKGSFQLATEDVASWMPGNTFTNSIMAPVVATIGVTEIVAGNDGKVRLTVLSTS